MSQTKQQEEGGAAAKPGARKDWEWFWRIVAGLMLIVIAWVVWVLYQITPRSVVTPLAYAKQVHPPGASQPTVGAGAPAAATQDAVAPPAPQQGTGTAAAEGAINAGGAAAQSGAHQASADAQSGATDGKQEQAKGLRLATELSVPPAGKPGTLKAEEGKPGGGGPATRDRP